MKNNKGMKYILFDVAVMVSLILTAKTCVTKMSNDDNGAAAAASASPSMPFMHQAQHHAAAYDDNIECADGSCSGNGKSTSAASVAACHEDDENDCQYSSPSLSPQDPQKEAQEGDVETISLPSSSTVAAVEVVIDAEVSHQGNLRQQEQPKHQHEGYKVGSIVELYSHDSSYFAIPTLVIQHDHHGDVTAERYTLKNTITNKRIHNVLPEYVHPYRIYQDGTRAWCDVSLDENNVHMTPCAISSHTIQHEKKEEEEDGAGLVFYQVSYLSKDGEQKDTLVEASLPFTKVQRIYGRKNGHMRRRDIQSI